MKNRKARSINMFKICKSWKNKRKELGRRENLCIEAERERKKAGGL